MPDETLQWLVDDVMIVNYYTVCTTLFIYSTVYFMKVYSQAEFEELYTLASIISMITKCYCFAGGMILINFKWYVINFITTYLDIEFITLIRWIIRFE